MSMTANEALEHFQEERKQEGSHVVLVITLGMNGLLQPWLAGGISDATYATMCEDIAKWATKEALLHRPQGRA